MNNEIDHESPRVLGLIRDNGANGLYRIEQPLNFAKKLNKCRVQVTGHAQQSEKSLEELLGESNVFCMPRPSTEQAFDFIDSFQKVRGMRFILDHDDDIFNVSPLSMHYMDYGLSEVKCTSPKDKDKSVMLWEDGTNYNGKVFDLKRNLRNMKSAIDCLSIADCVTVTTEELAEVYREYNDNVVVLPNCIDFSKWKKLPLVKDNPDQIRIVWHGGASHYEDWASISTALAEVINGNKNLMFVACGQDFKGLSGKINPDQFEFHPWVPVHEHARFQASLDNDIAILPLTHSKFNRGKSAIKWAEFAALKIPCIASNYPPYSKVVRSGQNGFLYNDMDEFKNCLEYLIDNVEGRNLMGEVAYEDCQKLFDIEYWKQKWTENFFSVMTRPNRKMDTKELQEKNYALGEKEELGSRIITVPNVTTMPGKGLI